MSTEIRFTQDSFESIPEGLTDFQWALAREEIIAQDLGSFTGWYIGDDDSLDTVVVLEEGWEQADDGTIYPTET